MKIITYSKIGYNAPSQANWNYGIWKIDFIDTSRNYCFSKTCKEKFGGDSRLTLKVQNELKYTIIQTQGVYTSTGIPKITGVSKMVDMENEEVFNEIKDFLK